jgi:hypothetical protein
MNRPGTNQVALIGGGIRLGLWQNGEVFFPAHGTTASAANAFYNSTTGALGRSTSSRKFKKEITVLESFDGSVWSNMLHNLEVVSYKSKIEGDDTNPMLGLIAEQTDLVAPILTSYDADGTPIGVQYDRMGPLAILELQKNKLEMEDMNNRLLALESLLVP